MMPADDEGAGAAPAPAAAAGDGDEEEEEEGGPWTTSPEFMTRSNSPLKRPSRSGKVWDMIKHLAHGHPEIKGGFTHVFTAVGCGSFFELKKTKGS